MIERKPFEVVLTLTVQAYSKEDAIDHVRYLVRQYDPNYIKSQKFEAKEKS